MMNNVSLLTEKQAVSTFAVMERRPVAVFFVQLHFLCQAVREPVTEECSPVVWFLSSLCCGLCEV